MTKKNTIGVRLNNPGNLKWIPGEPITPWQELTDRKVVETASGWFYEFRTALDGIRAAAVTLITYQDKHKIRTIARIIDRYAPTNENNTRAYINEVVKNTGFTATQTLDLHAYDNIFPVLKAIIHHENGYHPYTDAQIDAGLLRAGIPRHDGGDLSKSRTVKGGQVASVSITAAGAASVLTEARDQLMPLVPYAEFAKWLFLLAALGAIGVMLYARWDDHQKGLR